MTYYKGLKIQDKRSLVVAISTALLLIATVVAAWYILAPQKSVRADAINTTDFVTTWKTDISEDDVSTIVLPMYGANYSVDWDNDGVYDEIGLSGATTHDFGTPGTYTIRIGGAHGGWAQDPGMYPGNAAKITEVNQWGDAQWQSMRRAFYGAGNVKLVATDAPDLSQVTTMEEVFYATYEFNEPIDHWNVSNVTNMKGTFHFTDFNQPLNSWDVSNVTDMSYMFDSANRFNQPLNGWDVSNVTDMSYMFDGAMRFNQPLNNWDVSKVQTMEYMFGFARAFNGSIGDWDVSSVTNMNGMLQNATVFNQPLDGWDVSSVTIMQSMFSETRDFNQPIGSWDMSRVTMMRYMFSDTVVFNQPLNSWDVSSVENMEAVFYYSKAFNQPLDQWDISSVLPDQAGMLFYHSVVSPENFDTTLRGWLSLPGLPHGVAGIDGNGSQYCDPTPRQELIDNFGWVFYENQQGCGMIAVDGSYYNSPTYYRYADLEDNGDLGEISVEGLTPTSVTMDCTTPEYVTAAIGQKGNFEITGNRLVVKGLDPSADIQYTACIRAEDSGGSFTESIHRFRVTKLRQVDIVSFGEYKSQPLLVAQGRGLLSNQGEIGDATQRSMVNLNGVDIPFCADGFGMTAAEIVIDMDVAANLVSDGAPCYRLIDFSSQTDPYLLTPTSAQIMLPADFDITAPGTVSVNNSPVFAFNQPTGGGDDNGDDNNGGDNGDGGGDDGNGGNSDGGSDNSNDGPVYKETITVNGTKPIANQPVIPKKPTFTGTATPGARVVVTVHSDPVTCTTIADANGDWSCTLPSDLEPGQHTVIAVITNPDGSIVNLGPYTVSVSGGGSTGVVIDSKTPLVPNTGLDIIEKLRQHQRTKSIQGYIVAAALAGLAVAVVSITALSARRRKVVAFNRR